MSVEGMSDDKPSAPKMSRRQTMIGDHPVANAAMMLEMYEPGDVIGSGSFGIIRKVVRKSDSAVLARKELNYRKMEERDLKQLNEEVRILQAMPPNEYIIRYHERYIDKTNFTLHIVMEYCEGGDLTHVISKCRHEKMLLPEDLVWSYLTQIASALADCHSETDTQGNRKTVILHRDIKPENVFLTKDNIVKLGDFGLSKAMAYAAFTNTYVGTPYYMSPELLQGVQYDVKSDIWALGCLIFELCAWQPPFAQAQSQPELAKLVREGKIPGLPQGYSTSLGQVVRSMLRQDPRQRPTAKQILGHDQVKLQIKSNRLRKIHDQLLKERELLTAREGAIVRKERLLLNKEAELSERERAVMFHEKRLQLAKEAFEDEKERLVHALGAHHHAVAGNYNGNASLGGSSSSNLSDSVMDDQDEGRPYTASSTSSMASDNERLRKVASRKSLIPQRGTVDDRRTMQVKGSGTISVENSMLNVTMCHRGQLTRRLSSNSLMSLDDTPGKHNSPTANFNRMSIQIIAPNDGTARVNSNNGTPSAIASAAASARKRIHQSRSMLNLNSANKALSARQLFPSASKDGLRAIAKAQEAANAYPSPAPSNESDPYFSEDQVSPDLAAISLVSILQQHPSSPSKRSAAAAFSSQHSKTASPTRSSHIYAGDSNTLAPASRLVNDNRPSPLQLGDSLQPEWDFNDEDSLPSPFLKRAPAAPQVSRPTVSVTMPTARSSHTMPVRTAPNPPPTRTLRPSSSRQTLASKSGSTSRAVKVDEQGRILREKRSAATLR